MQIKLFFNKITLYFYFVFVVISNVNAKNIDKQDKIIVSNPVIDAKTNYDMGISLVECNKYGKASNYFYKCYIDSPLSDIAFSGLIMEAYCLYKEGRYNDAIISIDDILLLRPDKKNDPDFEYVQYLKILCYVQSYISPSYSVIDIETAQDNAKQFLVRYPNSVYNRSIEKVILPFITECLYEKEIYVGRYYLHNTNTVAALARFANVLEVSQNKSIFVPEACYRTMECYVSMGLESQLQDLMKRYENHKFFLNKEDFWYKKAQDLVKKHS